MEVYKMLPEGTLAELIEGNIYMSPSPLKTHQRIVTLLSAHLTVYVEERGLGEIYVSPFDVYLDEEMNAVQPDIVFVASKNLHIVQGHVHGVPDLLVEVLSPGNMNHDKVKKKALYEKFGVKEFWIIDPDNKEATGYFLENGSYAEFHKSTGSITSRLLNSTFQFS